MPVFVNNSVFIHLPKNAGTSITNWLVENVNGEVVKRKHDSFDLCKQRYPNRIINFSYAVVRNPWDRLVSAYFYNRKFYERKYSNIDDLILKKSNSKVLTKLNYIKESKNIVEKDFNYFVKQLKYLPVEHLQTEMCKGVKYILTYENLQKDFEVLQNYYNIDTPLPINNKSNHKQYQQYYNNDTIDIVYNYYRDDIKKWNYEF